MKATEVKTLAQLVDYINSCDDWSLEVNDIIERNGWEDNTGDAYGVCSDGSSKVVLNEQGEAELI